jgi:hypothetical protein
MAWLLRVWWCRCGGRGAILSGSFQLEKGQRLRVLCGGMSDCGPQGNTGGGGGTYVIVEDEDEPLIVAGGGGGTRCDCSAAQRLQAPHRMCSVSYHGKPSCGTGVDEVLRRGSSSVCDLLQVIWYEEAGVILCGSVQRS